MSKLRLKLAVTFAMVWFATIVCHSATVNGQELAASGLSAQSVLLVVNSQSPESLAVANHYVALRNIPPVNVVYLEHVTSVEGDDESITSANFRVQILAPISKAMAERGIRPQIHCIAYSAGFPTRVLIQPEVNTYLAYRQKEYDIHYHAPFASLSSATFFHETLFSDEPTFLDEHSNWYGQNSFVTSRVFSSQINWSEVGAPSLVGRKYLLSTVLAVVRPKGSTLDQAISQLTRSASADGKRPHGVFYFAHHPDPRSRTRDHQYAAAARSLQELGFKAEVSAEVMPQDSRVLGATLGTAKLDWSSTTSEFAPGAICDNFTSYGAWWKQSQTLLTHFLNHGAAGATGTVYEPYTIPSKIPTAAAHVHYARGCTLVESIYQTVLSPYQLLVVGDPLCRPFASLPRFTVEGIQDKAAVRKNLEIKLKAKWGQNRIASYAVFLDGVYRKSVGPSDGVSLPLNELSGGYHELRITAFDSTIAHATSTQVFDVFVLRPNSASQPKLKLKVDDLDVNVAGTVSVSCAFPKEMKSVRLVQNARVLGEFPASNAPISLEAKLLGIGETKLHASTTIGDQIVRGVPVGISIRQ